MLELDHVQKIDVDGSASLMISATDASTVQTAQVNTNPSFLSIDRPTLDLQTLRVSDEGEAGTSPQ